MKKITFMLVAFLSTIIGFAQGSENFDNATALPTGSNYGNGNFVGNDGITWTYVHCQTPGDYEIDGNGILLRRSNEPSSISATIQGGISSFSVDTKKGYTSNTARKIELLINGIVVEQFQHTFADADEIVPFEVEDINVEGEFILELRMYGATGNQHIVLDNIEWTGYTGSTPPPTCDIVVNLTFPDYGDVTTWRLLDGNGIAVLSGGPYEGLDDYDFSITATHIAVNPPYILEITTDDWWWGFCDNEVNYSVIVGGVQDISGTMLVCEDTVTESFPLITDLTACAPDCPAPNILSAQTVAANSVELSWNSSGTLFSVEWGEVGFIQGDGNQIDNITSTSVSLDETNNLVIGQSYQFYVIRHCELDESSTWSGPYTFTVGAYTYTGGNISTQHNDEPTINSTDFCIPEPTITIEVPNGYQISGLQVQYNMTAHNDAYMSEQFSFIYSPTLELGENSLATNNQNSEGTYNYSRTLDFANGATGSVSFVLRAWRDWSSLNEDCNTDYNYVNNGTWIIIPTFEEIIEEPCEQTVFPVFMPVNSICQGGFIAAPLPTTSTDGITGTWSPAFNNQATTTYEFIPNEGQCAETVTMTIVVNPNIVPVFDLVSGVCAGDELPALPMVSNNDVTGTWFPEFNNQITTIYTFMPDEGQCASVITKTIVVNTVATPIAESPQTLAQTETMSDIVVTGVTGTLNWYSDENLENEVEESFVFTESSYTFWVTQTVGDCTSEAVEVVLQVTLSSAGFDNTMFRAYPNPVKDYYTISYDKEITNVSVVNMLGQTVINKIVNSTTTQIDMTTLPSGNYFVKVNIDGAIKTLKVIK